MSIAEIDPQIEKEKDITYANAQLPDRLAHPAYPGALQVLKVQHHIRIYTSLTLLLVSKMLQKLENMSAFCMLKSYRSEEH